jgi:NAD(P)-dependent dehydrogenase (short-subunit alcohol dehydrogenase family)
MKEFIRKTLGGRPPVVPGERFRDRVVVVTGASSGIGLATAEAFAREGAHVALLARRDREGNDALERVRKAGGDKARPTFIRTDVAVASEVEAAFATIRDTYGRLDAAFNNAGVMHDGHPAAAFSEAEFDRVMAVNVKGVWLCMREEIALMKKHALHDGAAIVNMASVSGLRGAAFLAPYAASKHAVVGLTRSAALDYVEEGFRINAICPGFVRTEMTRGLSDDAMKRRSPAGRKIEPEAIAGAVLWMCSDEAAHLVGQALAFDDGVLA